MKLDRDQLLELADLVADRVVEQLAKRFPIPRPRRRGVCGRGSSPPECWGSTIYGPAGCTCTWSGR